MHITQHLALQRQPGPAPAAGLLAAVWTADELTARNCQCSGCCWLLLHRLCQWHGPGMQFKAPKSNLAAACLHSPGKDCLLLKIPCIAAVLPWLMQEICLIQAATGLVESLLSAQALQNQCICCSDSRQCTVLHCLSLFGPGTHRSSMCCCCCIDPLAHCPVCPQLE